MRQGLAGVLSLTVLVFLAGCATSGASRPAHERVDAPGEALAIERPSIALASRMGCDVEELVAMFETRQSERGAGQMYEPRRGESACEVLAEQGAPDGASHSRGQFTEVTTLTYRKRGREGEPLVLTLFRHRESDLGSTLWRVIRIAGR